MGPDDNLSNEITYTDKKVNVKHDSTEKINGDLRVTSKAEVLTLKTILHYYSHPSFVCLQLQKLFAYSLKAHAHCHTF